MSRRFQRAGVVYLVSEPHGMFKIGHTTRIEERFKTLQLACPYDLQLLDILLVTDRHQAETFIHGVLAQYHSRGEWFSLPNGKADYDKAVSLLRSIHPSLLSDPSVYVYA